MKLSAFWNGTKAWCGVHTVLYVPHMDIVVIKWIWFFNNIYNFYHITFSFFDHTTLVDFSCGITRKQRLNGNCLVHLRKKQEQKQKEWLLITFKSSKCHSLCTAKSPYEDWSLSSSYSALPLPLMWKSSSLHFPVTGLRGSPRLIYRNSLCLNNTPTPTYKKWKHVSHTLVSVKLNGMYIRLQYYRT